MDFPDKLDESLEYGQQSTAKFNRKGTLLAVGTKEGFIAIWDFHTRSLAKALHFNMCYLHPGGVTKLSWSRNSRKLASCGSEGRVIRWDIENGRAEKVMQFSSALNNVQLHPKKIQICVS